MKEVLFNKNGVEVRCEYGDVALYSDYLIIVKKIRQQTERHFSESQT